MSLLTFIFILGILVHFSSGGAIEKPDATKLFTSRIFGGVDAPEGSAPYMVALIVGEYVATLFCGGSLVTKRHVLSAAHCIEPMVVWGELHSSFLGVIGTNEWNSPENIIQFKHYEIHPEWDRVIIKSDAGILFLEDEVQLNKRIGVISLNFLPVGGGVKCFVTGYGNVQVRYDGDVVSLNPTPDKLQLLHVKTISSQRCIEEVERAAMTWGSVPPVHPRVEICTFHSPNHGMCNGDSGSALIREKDNKQVGIVSWGFPCANGYPDVFVRLTGVKDFLLSILAAHIIN